ncbi:MAG: mannose-1-phosphate guanylyltransferase, partial [Synergistota bacterium]|nr:mannose-1-phosphate guanylyltransferase [Synergistota bacterium]
MYTLILAGGSGTRLWPLSRKETPKQFLKLFGDHTLLEDTVMRAARVSAPGRVHVVSGADWRALVEHQARNVWPEGKLEVIAEPCGRNTAPAVALGLAWLIKNGASPDDVVMVCPSDHVIADDEAFESAVGNAVKTARLGWITTFGVTPAGPETGYGYIKIKRPMADGGLPMAEKACHSEECNDEESLLTGVSLPPGVFAIERFVEKPDLDTAKRYLAEGGYFWNSGMFVFRIGDMVEAMKRHV